MGLQIPHLSYQFKGPISFAGRAFLHSLAVSGQPHLLIVNEIDDLRNIDDKSLWKERARPRKQIQLFAGSREELSFPFSLLAEPSGSRNDWLPGPTPQSQKDSDPFSLS